MFIYAQTTEHSTWVPVKYTPKQTDKELQEQGFVRATILRLDKVLADGERDASYAGPFFMDLDAKDLADGIAAAKLLHTKLLDRHVPERVLQWSCSGSKGFHLVVDEHCFSSGRASTNLPAIYSEMAGDLMVFGTDFSVYNAGKGTCWRLHNVRREDGKYRVRIAAAELMRMDPDTYRELTSAPRDFAPNDEVVVTPFLTHLFDKAKAKVRRPPKQTAAVVDDINLEQFREAPPACVQMLMAGKTSEKINFNAAAIQASIFVVHAGCSGDVADNIYNNLAANCSSTTYDSLRHRHSHAESTHGFIERNRSRYLFSCSAMRGACSAYPCNGCALSSRKATNGTTEYADLLDKHDLAIEADGIWTVRGGNRSMLTTFNMSPVTIFRSEKGVREGVAMQLQTPSGESKISLFAESDWDSRSGLLTKTHGLNGASFMGSETDIQRMKHAIMCSPEAYNADEVTVVSAAGIFIDTRQGDTEPVFVEPGFSINRYGVKGTHQMQDTENCPPPWTSLQYVPNPARGDKVIADAVLDLLRMNSPQVMSQIIGWVAACGLKSHIHETYGQFPSLGLWGPAGSGKSLTSKAVTSLAGVNYKRDPPMSAPNTTRWPLMDLLRSSRTIPRILEEFNLTGNRIHSSMQGTLTEAVKSTFDGAAIARGFISKGSRSGMKAATMMIPMVAPVMFISEQEVQMPALRQRSIQVRLTNVSRAGREPYMQRAYMDPRARVAQMQFSKALVNYALKLSVQEVADMVAKATEAIGNTLEDRTRHAYACALTGLYFLDDVSQKMGMGDELSAEVGVLQEALIGMASEADNEIAAAKQLTEVDRLLEKIWAWTTWKCSDDPNGAAVARRLVQVGPEYTDIDLQTAMFALTRDGGYAVRGLAITDHRTAASLLRSESYYVGESEMGPQWVRLGNAELAKRGHNMFARART